MYQNQAREVALWTGTLVNTHFCYSNSGCGTPGTPRETACDRGRPIEKGPRNSFYGMLIKDRTGQIDRLPRSRYRLVLTYCIPLFRRSSSSGQRQDERNGNWLYRKEVPTEIILENAHAQRTRTNVIGQVRFASCYSTDVGRNARRSGKLNSRYNASFSVKWNSHVDATRRKRQSDHCWTVSICCSRSTVHQFPDLKMSSTCCYKTI